MPLSQTEPLTVMISSRCNDRVTYKGEKQSMEIIRRAMKERLEAIKLGGHQVFKVWIHEDESDTSAITDNWDSCLENSRDTDVFIVLYNGRSGWLGTDNPVKDGVGICHAELMSAYNNAPSKVRSIQFKEIVSAEPESPDDAFQSYFRKLKIPGAQVSNGENALKRAEKLAAAVILSLAREGVGVNSTGKYYAGEALEWSRMNFVERREVMTNALVELIRSRYLNSIKQPSAKVAAVDIQETTIGFICDSIPASMATAAAREMVGQPFLKDHEHSENWDEDINGPVHVIACQKGVSETQALRLLGFPDAIVVSPPFGVYIADEVQKIQMAFISNCRDETTTREKVQRFLNWLNEQGEAEFLVSRARDRRQLCNFMRGLRFNN